MCDTKIFSRDTNAHSNQKFQVPFNYFSRKKNYAIESNINLFSIWDKQYTVSLTLFPSSSS